ncbi:hypothetical protein NIES4101_53820 [Calothrix sp. NIES-4101]|nr:hypothetical protein NIES4101_53820 [Calothrix sp. NIES-4101]
MRIDLAHSLGLGKLAVLTPHNEPDKPISLEFAFADDTEEDMQEFLEEVFLRELSQARGHYGHLIDPEKTTNLDLISGVRNLESFTFISQEPEAIAPNPLPENVQS